MAFFGKISGTSVSMEKVVLPSDKPGYMVTVLTISNQPGAAQNPIFSTPTELAGQFDFTHDSMVRK